MKMAVSCNFGTYVLGHDICPVKPHYIVLIVLLTMFVVWLINKLLSKYKLTKK